MSLICIIEKGGPIFRPVAKPRGVSTAPRQSSVVGDSRSSVTPSGTRNSSSHTHTAPIPMPPPTVIPSTIRSISRGAEPSRASSSSVPSSSANPTSINTQLNRLPTPSSSQLNSSVMAISALSRSTPVPLMAAGQSRSSPIVIAKSSAIPTPLPANSTPPPTPMQQHSYPQHQHLTFNQVLIDPPPLQFQRLGQLSSSDQGTNSEAPAAPVDPQNGASGLPRVAINTDSVVKIPEQRRKSSRKNKRTTTNGEPVTQEGEEIEQKPTRKSTRSKKAKKATDDGAASGAGPQASDNVANQGHVDSTKRVKEPSKKRKRCTSSIPRSRKLSHTPFDPDAGPGEELDPTVVTMAALCSDTGQGRISSKAIQIQTNHAAWKASNREKRLRMKMLMESKKYGKKEGADEATACDQGTNVTPGEHPSTANAAAGPSRGSPSRSLRAPSTGPPAEDETGHGFDYSQAMSTSRFNVQVRIGPNGETIIDEESLFVDRNDENETVNYTHVEESDTTKFVNSSTYGKKYRGSRWSAEETELFFDVSLTMPPEFR